MNFKVFILLGFLSLIFFSCEEVNTECSCYNKALDGKETDEECKEFVEGLSEEELKEKANECFGQDIEDLSGTVGL